MKTRGRETVFHFAGMGWDGMGSERAGPRRALAFCDELIAAKCVYESVPRLALHDRVVVVAVSDALAEFCDGLCFVHFAGMAGRTGAGSGQRIGRGGRDSPGKTGRLRGMVESIRRDLP